MRRSSDRLLPTTLLAPLALAGLAACGGEGDGTDTATTEGGSTAGGEAAAVELDVEAAIAVYEAGACWSCHGRPHQDQAGLAGPDLAGLSEHWTASDLADFIADPEAWVAKDGRLAVMKTEYVMPMTPPMRPIALEDRLLMAEWLLTLE